ncbi:hypothetical protein NE237_008975 [Protea cynaroides]|uniref:Uncharacterized protein n=1 Tax=Protea cynaroides TaxID=273540 RepID=A0A9Q0R098_9MAGN|nr:hypothetical protein NE237_008975 [Protea cynaroides]
MAGLNQFYYLGFIALLLLILTPQAYSSARFLQTPEENKGVPSVRQFQHVFPCEMESGKNIPVIREVAPPEKMVRKYGRPLVLNLLPKGTNPPSGPSKGTDSLNN